MNDEYCYSSICSVDELSSICSFLAPADLCRLSTVDQMWHAVCSRWESWAPKFSEEGAAALLTLSSAKDGKSASSPVELSGELYDGDDGSLMATTRRMLAARMCPIVCCNAFMYNAIWMALARDVVSGEFLLFRAATGAMPTLLQRAPSSPTLMVKQQGKRTRYDDFDDGVCWDGLAAIFGTTRFWCTSGEKSDGAEQSDRRAAAHAIPAALWLLHTSELRRRVVYLHDDDPDKPTDMISVILSTALAVSCPLSWGQRTLPQSLCLACVDLFRFFASPAAPVVVTFAKPLIVLLRSAGSMTWAGNHSLCAASVEAIGAVANKLVTCGVSTGNIAAIEEAGRLVTFRDAVDELRRVLSLVSDRVGDKELVLRCCDRFLGPVTRPLLMQ